MPEPKRSAAIQFAELFYWASMLLLLAGAWLLIDPFNRKVGETAQVYITCGAFELYMWLLLGLAKWQLRKGLVRDAGRGGIFVLFLIGFLFMTINEMHLADNSTALGLSAVAVVLSLIKLRLAAKWLGVALRGPLQIAAAGWILALAASPLVILHASGAAGQHSSAYLLYWGIALLIAGHIPLATWQSRHGWAAKEGAFGAWWTPWLVLAILAILTVLQLPAIMWATFVQWAYWYLSPIFMATGIVAVVLALQSGCRRTEAWLVLGVAVMVSVLLAAESLPDNMPETWAQACNGYLLHPVYLPGLFLSLLIALTALLIKRPALYLLAMAAPAAAGAIKGLQAILHWKHGKGVAMFLGAFALLGAGAALQWAQQKWPPKTPPEPPTTDSEEQPATEQVPPPPLPSENQQDQV